MCGIAGILNDRNLDVNCPLRAMTMAMAHRGPDDEGVEVLPVGDRWLGLGHRRLAVIDPSPAGHQPMSDPDRGNWITFNGEIYNFPELREELEREGVRFRSRSDTEVILALYVREGESSFRKLRGMFAFALSDERTGDLFLVRDRYGIKPLYYWENGKELLFASTVEALVRSGRVPNIPNPLAPVAFLLTGSIPSPMTTVRDVFSLPPGHYGKYSKGKFSLHPYYRLDFSAKQDISYSEAASRVRDLFEDATVSHLLSDAPLGVFLSGGIDSSLLAAVASGARREPVTTLSVVFKEGKFDESRYQKMVSSRYGTDHRAVLLKEKDVLDMLSSFFGKMDQPTIDGLNTYVVSWAARKAGLKAVLSGLGGDELFCGYGSVGRYDWVKRLQKHPRLSAVVAGVLGRWRKSYLRLNGRIGTSPLGAYLAFRGLYSPSELIPVFGAEAVEETLAHLSRLSSDLTGSHSLDELSEMEYRHYLLNQLLKDSDVMGMAHSVEIRVPFLDHPLVDFVAALPPSYRYRRGRQKALLFDSCKDLLPDEIWDRPKQGFTFPFENWLREDLGKEMERVRFSDPRCQKVFKNSLSGFHSGREHWSRPYAWYVLQRSGLGN